MTELEKMLGDRPIYTDAPTQFSFLPPPVNIPPPQLTLSGVGQLQGHRNNFGQLEGQLELPLPPIQGFSPWLNLQGNAQMGNYMLPVYGGGATGGLRWNF